MNRILGLVSGLLLTLLVLVPVALAADPRDGDDEHFIFTTNGDITFGADERADVLVVVNGTATIEGDAGAVLVINGTANFVGAQSSAIVAIRSQVSLDARSVVSGDIRTFDSTVDAASGAVVGGNVRDLGPDLIGAPLLVGSALFAIYIAFVVSSIAAGLLLAGVASRQVRSAVRLIGHEPVATLLAAIAGIVGLALAGALAIVTLVGAPFGLGLLILVMPILFVVGYIVAGIWIGELIVARLWPGTPRRRPYLAAFVGLLVVGGVGIVPGVGGVISLIGFGSVVLLMWRAFRRDAAAAPSGRSVPVPSLG